MSLICFVFTGSPTRSGTIWVLDGITGSLASANACLSIDAEAWCASRSTDDHLRRRTLATSPATNPRDRAARKMMPSPEHPEPTLHAEHVATPPPTIPIHHATRGRP